jgi:hypothetical protein
LGLVISKDNKIPEDNGSVFFDALIAGVNSGDADRDARDATLGVSGSAPELARIVRSPQIDGYLEKAIFDEIRLHPNDAASLKGNQLHWFGPIEPVNVYPEGTFFFFQHPRETHPNQTGGGRPTVPYVPSQHDGSLYSPSINQLVQPISVTTDAAFEELRKGRKTVVGVDVSQRDGEVNWQQLSVVDQFE